MNYDPELLVGLSDAELEALADSLLAPSAQGRLDELLGRNAENQLAADERAELDRLLARVDQLTLLKTRARYTLRQRAGATEPWLAPSLRTVPETFSMFADDPAFDELVRLGRGYRDQVNSEDE